MKFLASFRFPQGWMWALTLMLVLCGATASQAQNVRPLGDVLEDWQGYSWSDIRDIAQWEGETDGPLYPSAPAATPHHESFEGDFTPLDANTKLAIFSDDGCDVWINGVKVHGAKGIGQALPDLSQSLHPIAYAFVGGQTYRIRVDYSNTYYVGAADIDGASLFAYTQVPVTPNPTATPNPTPTPGTPNPTPTPAPCFVSLQADGEDWHTINLSWNGCSDADFGSYQLFRSTDPNFTPDPSTYLNRGELETQVGQTTFEDGGLTPNTTYYYILKVNHAGTSTSAGASAKTTEVEVPAVEFEGLARACAGGVGVDGVHSFTITGTATREDGSIAANTPFTLSFENNRGHDYGDDEDGFQPLGWTTDQIKKAKFVITNSNGQQQLVETLTLTTNAEGKFSVTVLSSDIVSTDIKIQVKWKNAQDEEKDAGSQECDFGEAMSYRRFPNWIDLEEETDNGWLFGQQWLVSEGDETTAKIYMKFMVDLELGDVDGNWEEVNGHEMLLKIQNVDTSNGIATTNLSEYAFFPSARPDGAVLVTTSAGSSEVAGGAATVSVKAGNKIGSADVIWLSAINQSQWSE